MGERNSLQQVAVRAVQFDGVQPEPLRALRGHREVFDDAQDFVARQRARRRLAGNVPLFITSENVADKDEFSATPIAPFDGTCWTLSAASYQKH